MTEEELREALIRDLREVYTDPEVKWYMVTAPEYAAVLGVAESTARRRLRRLVEGGTWRAREDSLVTRYWRVEDEESELRGEASV